MNVSRQTLIRLSGLAVLLVVAAIFPLVITNARCLPSLYP